MSFSGICMISSQLSFYLCSAGYILSSFGEIRSPLLLLGIFVLSAIAGGFCRNLKGVLRFLPLLLTVPAFIAPPSVVSVVAAFPMAVFVGFHMYQRNFDGDSTQIRGFIPIGMGIMGAIFFLALLSSHRVSVNTIAVPCFVTWMGLSVLGLRVSRNERAGKIGPAFIVMNSLLVFSICFAGYLLSSPASLSALKTLGGTLYDHVVLPVLLGFTYAMIGVAMFFKWLSKFIRLKKYEPPQQEIKLENMDEAVKDIIEETELVTLPQWVHIVLICIVIALFFLVMFLIIRKLVDRSETKPSGRPVLERSAAAAIRPQKRFKRRGTPADSVRACYRRYLDICGSNSVNVDGRMASDRIAEESARFAGKEPAESLRSIWLPARYSDGETDGSDAEAAKILLDEIRNNAKKYSRH